MYTIGAEEAHKISENFAEARRLIDESVKAAAFKGKFSTTIEVEADLSGCATDILGSLGYQWDTKWSDAETSAMLTIKW